MAAHRGGRRRPRRLRDRRRGRPGHDSRRRGRRPDHGRRRRRQPARRRGRRLRGRRQGRRLDRRARRRLDSAWCGRGRDSVRAETLDALDLACESVDYGPSGQVGRSMRVTGGGRFVPRARPDLGARGPAHPRRRALPRPPLPRAHHRGVRDRGPRAVRRAPARPGGRHRAGRRAAPGRTCRASRAGPSHASTTRASRSAGSAGTATTTTATRPSASRGWLRAAPAPVVVALAGPPRRPARTVWVFAVR